MENKRITLQRFIHDKVTFGKMTFSWLPDAKDVYTIELPWLDNKTGSCIPAGLYNCIPHNSPKHPNTWELLYVPNRSEILIHNGNFACEVKLLSSSHESDTEGCILVGMGIEENIPMITRSKEAMEYLHSIIGDDNFSIEVKNG